jgi:hypothetical protein
VTGGYGESKINRIFFGLPLMSTVKSLFCDVTKNFMLDCARD